MAGARSIIATSIITVHVVCTEMCYRIDAQQSNYSALYLDESTWPLLHERNSSDHFAPSRWDSTLNERQLLFILDRT